MFHQAPLLRAVASLWRHGDSLWRHGDFMVARKGIENLYIIFTFHIKKLHNFIWALFLMVARRRIENLYIIFTLHIKKLHNFIWALFLMAAQRRIENLYIIFTLHIKNLHNFIWALFLMAARRRIENLYIIFTLHIKQLIISYGPYGSRIDSTRVKQEGTPKKWQRVSLQFRYRNTLQHSIYGTMHCKYWSSEGHTKRIYEPCGN